MAKLEQVILAFEAYGSYRRSDFSPVAMLLVTLFYLIAVLSVSILSPDKLIWLAIYPVIMSEYSGFGFGRVFIDSLWVLPLVVLIGFFNPWIDTDVAIEFGGLEISRGWVSFTSIVLRGLLSMQAVIILVRSCGFNGMCLALRKMKVPSILVAQLLLTYRYLLVLLEEVVAMKHAREARGFGLSSYPLKLWGAFIGQLLLRSIDRAERIHRAMLSRGFDGIIPEPGFISDGSRKKSLGFFIIASFFIAGLRWLPLSAWCATMFKL